MSSGNEQFGIPLSPRNTSGLSEMTFSDLKSYTKGAVLSFYNICYREKVKSGFLLRCKTVEKELLSNISGIMRPGLNAILGPPGAGKSVLLDVLAARKHPEKFSGGVLINGESYPDNLKYYSGYVAKVGTEQIQGVSRAERKKTSIAMELVTDPSILFLDEPTNALDCSTAHAVFLLLKRRSKQGRTIIFSIHQPRHSIFEMFDSLTLLAAGKLIFHGPAQMVVHYFASAGYNCELYTNHAVFLLDVISGVFPAVESDTRDKDHERMWIGEEIEVFSTKEEPVIEKLAKFYENSSLYQTTKLKLDQLSDGWKKKDSAFKEFTYATSIWHQLRWISWRSFKNFLGDRQTSIIQIFIMIIQVLLIGVFLVGIKNDCDAIQIRVWMFCLVAISFCEDFVSAVQLFLGEKKLFMHEYMSGYYKEPSYFLGKLLCDLIPKRFLQCFIFTFILYITVGLRPAVEAFFITMLTLWMMACSTDSVMLAITVGQNVLLPIALFLGFNFLWFMLMLSFMIFLFRTTGFQFLWLQYISIPHISLTALQHNEFLGQNFCPGLGETGSNGCPDYVVCSGEEFLTSLGIDVSPWGLWKNHVALAVVMIVFFTITFIKLILVKKYF
ncbi:broad substrate specificity ATP-binding cassette transporter ABCG2-like isoform X1 [Cavia porcellus]|uniref:broad substrate specificity ATP-binding cassette transporter ABCG2-like isoform X1 n=1 Tax=Cavia porcellus TaxID=10141 RepID=UPI002FE425F3